MKNGETILILKIGLSYSIKSTMYLYILFNPEQVLLQILELEIIHPNQTYHKQGKEP